MMSQDDHERLANAIREVEARSAGEVVVVVAEQAGTYRSIPILWALLGALLTPWPLIWITTLGAPRIFLAQLVVAVVLGFFLSLPKRRYALVPRFVKRAQAHEAAAREFLRRGLTRTRDRTGILIYIALAEHHAEILADTGIADRVEAGTWQEIIANLTGAIREGRIGDGLVAAVQQAGSILAEHAPARFDDTDELPNKVILL